MIVTVPSASKRMPPISCEGGAVTSRYWPMPRPRSLPRCRLSARRASNPSQSASASARSSTVGKSPLSYSMPEGAAYGICSGLDVVAPAQLDPVDPHLGRGGVDQPLHVVVALRPPGAAIGADRGRVGEHAVRGHLDQRRRVDADHVLGRVAGRRDGGGVAQIGAEVAVDAARAWPGTCRRRRAPARHRPHGRGHGCRTGSSRSARRSTSPAGRAGGRPAAGDGYSG